MNANVRTIGGSIGSADRLDGHRAGVAAGAIPHERGYVVAFAVMGVALGLAGVAAALVPSRAARRAAAAGRSHHCPRVRRMGFDAAPVGAAEAGLAIGEHRVP